MKNFTTKQEIRDLLNKVIMDEVSFTRMVEILNERVNERVNQSEVNEFKEGDFLHSDWDDENITLIIKNKEDCRIYYHASKSCYYGTVLNDSRYWRDEGDFRHATEAEKQELLDALEKEGKRWDEEKKCIEDIPKRKFKKGDKVRIKEVVSSKTHNRVNPGFAGDMDELIGKTMTVDRYTDWDNYVKCEGIEWVFPEDWLEPYEELKEDDLAIFWDVDKGTAIIGKYDYLIRNSPYPHKDKRGNVWRKAIKFESKEQYEKLLKGEI